MSWSTTLDRFGALLTHENGCMWVRHYPEVGYWQAYKATEGVPPGRSLSTVDNVRIGGLTGFTSEADAKAAVESVVDAEKAR